MRVSGSSGKRGAIPTFSGGAKAKNEEVLGLNKNETISDLFNNTSPSKEENHAVRLRISYGSKALYQNLKTQVEQLLSKNKELHKALKEIPLAEQGNTEKVPEADLSVRRLMLYHSWLHLEGDKDVEGADAPFFAVQSYEQDEKIKEIFDAHAQVQQQELQRRKASTPNYYYLVYPETYSFN